jgi:glycosyltransferase involved in cell wall biosynthesis
MAEILVLVANARERGTWFRARRIARGLFHRGHRVAFVCTGPGYYRPVLRHRDSRWLEWETACWQPHSPIEGHSPLGLLQRVLGLRRPWDLVYTFSHHPIDQWAARMVRRASTFWMTDWCDLWSSTRGGLLDEALAPTAGTRPPWHRRLLRAAAHRIEDHLEEQAVRLADATSIIVSPMRAETRRLGVADDRVLHLISGADLRRIPVLDRAECRRQLGIDPTVPVIGHVANYTPDNTQLEAALERTLAAHPRAMMLSVGPTWYAPGGAAARAERAGRLVNLGRRPFVEIPRLLGAADFLVMPLRDTPFNRCRWPNKLGDYLAAGRAVATTMVGDMGSIVAGWQVGVVGEPTNEGLAAAMMELLADPPGADEMGARARRLAERRLSWASRIDRLVRFLRGHGLEL